MKNAMNSLKYLYYHNFFKLNYFFLQSIVNYTFLLKKWELYIKKYSR